MTTDDERSAELHAQVAAAPGDPAVLVVYADFLEEIGDTDRALYVRTELALRSVKQTDPTWVEHVKNARALVATLPRAWTDAFTYPPIAERVYEGRSNNNTFVCRFLASGQLNYTQATGTYQNGTWWQIGSLVFWEMNKHYADYIGTLANGATLLVGDAGNVAGGSWVFRLEMTSKPELAAIPENTNTTVYAYGDEERRPRPPMTATRTGVPEPKHKPVKHPPGTRKAEKIDRYSFPFDFEMAQLDERKKR